MSFLFVTVGTTAIRNPDVGKAPDLRDNRGLQGEVSAYLRSPDQRPGNWEALETRLVKAHLRYWEAGGYARFDPANYLKTSAELVSTMGAIPFLSRRKQDVSEIVLLASDTDEGEFAAGINEAVLRKIVPRGVRVRMVRVTGLEARPSNLTRELDEVVRRAGWSEGTKLAFNVTGGFKGAVPSITYLALMNGAFLLYQYERQRACVALEYGDGREAQRRAYEPNESGVIDIWDIG